MVDVARWTKETDRPIARNALSRHANQHLGVTRLPGPLPPAASFLERVVAVVDDDVQSGAQRPTVSHAIAAQSEINRQTARGEDRNLMAKIALLLSGAYTPSEPLPVSAGDELYDTWLEALGRGDTHEAKAAVEEVGARLGLAPGDATLYVTGEASGGGAEAHAKLAAVQERVAALD